MKVGPSFTGAYPRLYSLLDHFNKGRPHGWSDNVNDDLVLVSVQPEKIVFEFNVKPSHCNHLGNIHGGCVATLIDICTSFAVFAHQGKTKWKHFGVSTDLVISYYKGITEGETTGIECNVHRVGKNLANLTATIYNTEGQPCYTGSHTKFCVDSRL
ncbi:HotDog domain-containing protein [Chlamydoabsidia padenii]|nr:HotDog domain-containing protein [Chlamydoabsidia padenii]